MTPRSIAIHITEYVSVKIRVFFDKPISELIIYAVAILFLLLWLPFFARTFKEFLKFLADKIKIKLQS